MKTIDMYKANDLIYNKYEPIWDTLSEDVVFICETLSCFRWEKEVDIEWFLRVAKIGLEEYSDSIKNLSEKEIIQLLNKVIEQ